MPSPPRRQRGPLQGVIEPTAEPHMPDTRPNDSCSSRRAAPADAAVCAALGGRPRSRRSHSKATQRQQWEPYLFIDQLRLIPQDDRPGPGLRMLTAITVATDGRPTTRFLLPVRESHAECWVRMLTQLQRERLPDLRLIVADGSPVLRAATLRAFPRVQWQQSIPAFCARVLAQIPAGQRTGVARRLRNIYRQPDRTSATAQAIGVAALLARLGHWSGAVYFARCYQDTLTFYSFPESDWQQLREQAISSELRGSIRRQLALDGRDDGWHLEGHGASARLHLLAPGPVAAASGGSPMTDDASAGLPKPGGGVARQPPSTISTIRGAQPADPEPTFPPDRSSAQNTGACDSDGAGGASSELRSEQPPPNGRTADGASAPELPAWPDYIETEPTRPPAIHMEIIEVEDRYGYTRLFEHEQRAAALATAAGARATPAPRLPPKGRLRRVADLVLGRVGAAVPGKPAAQQAADAPLATAVGASGMTPAPPGPT